jgi:hypothetical protein
MTPQEKQVFSKLFPKTELGTHEIELTALEDIKKVYDKLNTENSNLNKVKTESEKIRKMYDDVITKRNEFKSIYESNKTLFSNLNKMNLDSFNQLNKQAKELGLSINDSPAYKEYLNNFNLLKDLIDNNQKNWNLIFEIK